jgi:tape measure domain-containing protein
MNIGSITFGVDAHTQPMLNALKDIQKFRAAVTRTATVQKTASQQEIAGMTKREVAMRKAMRATLDLQASQRKLIEAGKLEQNAIDQSAAALRRYIAELKNSKTSTLEFARASQGFTEKMDLAKRKVKELNDTMKAGSSNQYVTLLRNLESASVLAIGPLSGLGARIRSLSAIMSRSSAAIVIQIGVIVGLTVALWKMSAASLNASKIFEASMARFKAGTGDVNKAAQEMKFVIDTSIKLGLRIEDTAKAYSRLTAAAMGSEFQGEKTRKIFLSIAQAAAALRLNNSEVEGAFRAIEQIMSKGTVQAEELRGQLGERLPGAFRLAAESMGLTTMALGKLLKTGELTAAVFLPRFAQAVSDAFSEDAKSNVDSYTGSMNNLSNAALLFSKRWDEVTGTSRLAILSIKAATGAINLLTMALGTIAKVIASTAAAFVIYKWGLVAITLATKGFITVSATFAIAGRLIWQTMLAVRAAMVAAAAGTWALNTALLANPFTGLATVIWRVVAAAAAFIAVWWGMDSATKGLTESLEEAEKNAADAKEAMEAFTSMEASQKLVKMTEDIRDMNSEIKNLTDAAAMSNDAKTMELYFQLYQEQSKAATLTTEELEARAKALGVTLSGDLKRDMDAVGSATFQLTATLKLQQEQFAANKSSAESLITANHDLAVAQQRLIAVSQGQSTADRFDAVGAAVMDYQLTLDKAALGEVEYNKRVREMTRLLNEKYDILVMIKAYEDSMTESQKAQEKSTEALTSATQKLNDQRARLVAAQKGDAELEYYDQVTKEVNKYRDAIADVQLSETERKEKLVEYERIMAQILAAEHAIKNVREAEAEATRALTKAEADRQKALEKSADAMDKADIELARMQKSLEAMQQGSVALEYFTNVTDKVDAFRQKLIDAGVPLADLAARTTEFQRILEQEESFKKFNELADGMANSIGNALEGLIMHTKSLKDSFFDLITEMGQLMLRALVIQPIIDNLSASMNKGASSGQGFGGFMASLMQGYAANAGAGSTSAQVGNMLSQPGMFAKGGYAKPFSDAIVGEDGPEILRMGSRGGTVIPTDKMKFESAYDNMPVRKTTNIVVNLPPTSSRRTAMQIATEIGQKQNRAQMRNR